jgi:hypothetical protein
MAKPRTQVVIEKQPFFSWKFSFGHVLAVISFLSSAAILWGHDEASKAVRDTQIAGLNVRMTNMENMNMPPRLAALEAQNKDTRDRLNDIRNVLIEIHTDLSQKADKR